MQAGDDKSFDDINVTPMVDLYLVLLLIFIIMTTAGVQGVKVDLPKGSKQPAKDLSAPKGKAITVNNEGKIFLDTVPVTLEQLEKKLNDHKAQNPDFPVVVRGDRATQYQGIMDVLDVVGRVGIAKIGLATQPPK
ncbi:MAG: biopolymer transport protein ExbD [Verrucomicrobia bacterium]|jgi:biopolymer transport protein ExbD|nr:MAG: biopolymer transport protein ExbD [Verrucomicrobiota bacterium]